MWPCSGRSGQGKMTPTCQSQTQKTLGRPLHSLLYSKLNLLQVRTTLVPDLYACRSDTLNVSLVAGHPCYALLGGDQQMKGGKWQRKSLCWPLCLLTWWPVIKPCYSHDVDTILIWCYLFLLWWSHLPWTHEIGMRILQAWRITVFYGCWAQMIRAVGEQLQYSCTWWQPELLKITQPQLCTYWLNR